MKRILLIFLLIITVIGLAVAYYYNTNNFIEKEYVEEHEVPEARIEHQSEHERDTVPQNDSQTVEPNDNPEVVITESPGDNNSNVKSGSNMEKGVSGSSNETTAVTQEGIKTEEEEKVAISQEKIQGIENSVSLEDKTKAIKLILSKLSLSDIKYLQDLVQGGLTDEEKKKAVEMVYSKYTEEEIALIKELYRKYMGQ